MKNCLRVFIFLSLLSLNIVAQTQDGFIEAFPFEENDLKLERLAQPGTPFDKVGRKFGILGFESGSFEAWAYPLKLFRNFQFSFFLGSSSRPILGSEIVRSIEVTPERTTLTFTYQSFTIKAHYITCIDEAGSVILLDVVATEPISIVCSFLPVMQPMWPAGIGGQYAYWNNELKAYIISEPTRQNHGIVGSPAAVGLSYTPAHMLSDVPNEFRIEIDEPQKIHGRFIPIVMAGGRGDRESIIRIYRSLATNSQSHYRAAAKHYQKLRASTLNIMTPNPKINLAFEWAKVAYDNLVVHNPDLGIGLVAGLAPSGTSGRPGFGWFFGGDTYINSLSFNSYCDYATVQKMLEFMVQFQRDDGKMAHEITQSTGYIDWFGEYPYGYIHGDTSPYFIVAVHDYIRMSGDMDFGKRHWKTIQKAYEWSLSTDENGDGLMDNKKAGLGALEYGELAGGIATDIYVGAVWVKATQAMPILAELAGKKLYAKKVQKQADKALTAFRNRFWDEASQVYAYAFNASGEHVKEFSPWNAVGLMWGLGDSERSVKTLERIGSSELMTDWGVRSISRKSSYFQSLNYNYGAVWPFLNSWVTLAQLKHHFLLQGYASLMASVGHVFNNQLGAVGEVFSGSLHTWPQESVAHQGFSTASTVLPLVRGLLGLEGDAIEKMIWFSPHLPADWNHVSINNYKIGGSTFSFQIKRSRDRLKILIRTENADGYKLQLAPTFAMGTGIESVSVNNLDVSVALLEFSQVILPKIIYAIKSDSIDVEYRFRPTVEVLPPVLVSKVGDINRGLRIVSMKRTGTRILLECEGLAETSYEIQLVNADLVQSVEGGRLLEDRIITVFPSGQVGEYVRKRVVIESY